MKVTPTSSEGKSAKTIHQSPSITYKLSQELFKTLGWTSLPQNAVVVPFVTMKAKFSHNVISPWFASGKRKMKLYKSGRLLCLSGENGTGSIYYPNGRLAIGVSKMEEATRIIVKTPGGVDRDGVKRRPQLCAVFDSLGNGVVYDCDKQKRLVYNQKYGAVWPKKDGIPMTWQWHDLEYVGSLTDVTDNRLRRSNIRRKDMSVVAAMRRMESEPDASDPGPLLTDSENFQQSDCDNYVNTSRVRGSFPMKPVVIQISTNVSLRIFSQADIVLTFFADGQQTRLNIGVLYSPRDILSVDKVFAGSVTEKIWCPFEVLPVKTRSMEIIRCLIKKEKSQPCWNLN